MCMFQVIVYFANGSVLRSSPMMQDSATEFVVSFVKRVNDDIVSIRQVPISKDEAQKQFGIDAEEWKKFAEDGRVNPATFNAENDRLAVHFYHSFKTLALSS